MKIQTLKSSACKNFRSYFAQGFHLFTSGRKAGFMTDEGKIFYVPRSHAVETLRAWRKA
jgi:hypothetical protein